MTLSVVILAAGKGKRMRSGLPKVLHTLAGVTLLERVVRTASSLDPETIYVVYGNGGQLVRSEMAHLDVQWVEQPEALGTGHAVRQVLPHLNQDHQVLVLYGDVPLISKETLKQLLDNTPKNALGLVVAELEDPQGFGRIIRNEMGNIVAIVEQKDTNPEQQKITEINTGILTTSARHLKEWLPRLTSHNSQKEYYLTDIIAMAVADGYSVGGILARRPEEVRGINNLSELASLERIYQRQKAYELMMEGVTIVDPERFDVRGEAIVAMDVCIDINVILEGKVSIGANSVIGPNTVLRNVEIGENVKIEANCVIENSSIADFCTIGPFARIRPGNRIDQHARIGNFVEMKNSQLGEGSKVPHLSYIGDAVIGKNVNMGAGTITVNYDGISKHQTIIEDQAFVGCDSQLIAPVKIGEGAYIAAGSTITTNAPAHQLTVARAKQRTVEGWKPKAKKTVESS
ncbi:MAG TPA: bifunctional UDP-N-acetylglucosamine diphosphorylase/glucosamine-1-phosphate N-acetyltransferase GlmU [Gammaproteobacteria bacterium]|nr:bifunctional UDP-N-acetylglucosamine diphosphorylase/glucosamine-1-phosphate N-acetyltransferase GlmU [Gammaproteobacteria bacterium]